MSAPGDLWQGVASVPRAAGLLLREPRLQRLAAWPALLSVALFALLAWLSLRYGGGLLQHSGGWWSVARGLVVVLLLGLSAVVTVIGSNLIAAPFIDLLSQATEVALGRPPSSERLTLAGFIGDLLTALREVLMDLALWLALVVLLLPLHLLPLIGSAAHGLLSGLAGAAFAGVGMAGSALWRRRLRGAARWRQVWTAPWPLVGLGLATLALMAVPLAQLLTMPVAVIAGTLLVVELEQAARLLPNGEPAPPA